MPLTTPVLPPPKKHLQSMGRPRQGSGRTPRWGPAQEHAGVPTALSARGGSRRPSDGPRLVRVVFCPTVAAVLFCGSPRQPYTWRGGCRRGDRPPLGHWPCGACPPAAPLCVTAGGRRQTLWPPADASGDSPLRSRACFHRADRRVAFLAHWPLGSPAEMPPLGARPGESGCIQGGCQSPDLLFTKKRIYRKNL